MNELYERYDGAIPDDIMERLTEQEQEYLYEIVDGV